MGTALIRDRRAPSAANGRPGYLLSGVKSDDKIRRSTRGYLWRLIGMARLLLTLRGIKSSSVMRTSPDPIRGNALRGTAGNQTDTSYLAAV